MKQCLIMTAVGFICGAIMFSYLIPKIFYKVDIRSVSPDGNPGSSNVLRVSGAAVGVTCMALDVLKAFIPVFVSVQILHIAGGYLIPVAVAPVAGHAFTPMLKFNGGKAVSTTYGSLLGLITITRFAIILALIMAFFRFVIVVRPDSAGVITDMIFCSLLAVLFVPSVFIKVLMVLISAIVAFKQIQRPDRGEFSVSIWHYSMAFRDNHVVFFK